MIGHIKIDRKILNWEWYQDANVCRLFIHLLLIANHKDGKWQGQIIKRGQVITGRKELSKDARLSEMQIRTCIKKLKSTNEITIQSTSKFSIITICKYDSYQSIKDKDNQQRNQQDNNPVTNNQPTNNQQVTTNKNDKNIIIKNKGENDFLKIAVQNDFVCYDVEDYILKDQKAFEKICIATSRSADEVKKELHLYHLWLAKKENYPLGKGAATAGIESWIHNSKNFKKTYNIQEAKIEKLPDANSVVKKYIQNV